MYRTIDTRKRQEADRRNSVVPTLEERLGPYARDRQGRFILFGSLARGAARYDSDVDLLIDFAPKWEGEAWRLAEAVCAEFRIEADIKPIGWCRLAFVEAIMTDARVIG